MFKKSSVLALMCAVFSSVVVYKAHALNEEEYIQMQQQQKAAEDKQPKVQMPSSVIVCRSKQCAPAKLSMSKEFIYNTLLHMLDSNARQKALVCTGNPNTHTCTEEYVSLPITVGITPAYMYIDDVKITDVSISPVNTMALNLVLNWDVSYNGQTPTCRPSKTLLYVKNVSNILLEDGGYSCQMTTVGNTTIKTVFAIDYIDLDYGYIGGFYSIGLSGPAFGGGSGYMILRLPNEITLDAKDYVVSKPQKSAEDEEEKTEKPHKTEAAPQATAVPAPVPSVTVAPIPANYQQQPTAQPANYQPQPSSFAPAPQPMYGVNALPTAQLAPLPTGQSNEPVWIETTPQKNGQAYAMPAAPTANYAPIPAGLQNSAPTNVQPAWAQASSAAPTALQNTAPVWSEVSTANIPAYNQAAAAYVQPTPNYVAAPVYSAEAGTASTTAAPVWTEVSPQALPAFQQYPQYAQPQPVYDSQYAQPQPYQQVDAYGNPYMEPKNYEPAPNVDTIIHYNHASKDYDVARAKQVKKQQEEAKAVDYNGVKVFPISNAAKATSIPQDKNSLSDYNQ